MALLPQLAIRVRAMMEMGLHRTIMFDDDDLPDSKFICMRVPGGWVYRFLHFQGGKVDSESDVFVRDGRASWPAARQAPQG